MAAQVIAGRYRLEHRLGAGGMSEVWAAQDLELDRTVAVKLLAPDADPARFEREARAAAALSHPNISALYDYGQDGPRRYMVLEYLPGGSLENRLAPGGPLPDAETQRIALEVAAGLAHAHDRGLVHRDLKPSNILFDGEGRAKIADFGIARLGTSPGMTAAGTVLGTAAYISPEQAAGETATAASDVYAFGVILFRMLTGRPLFESPDALALATMHRDRPPPPVSGLRRDAPPRLESLATAALAKSPADRPPDGRALLDELRGTGSAPALTDTAAVKQVLAPAAPRGRRRIAFALVALAALAAAGVALAIGIGSGGGGPPLPPASTTATTTPPTHTASPAVVPSATAPLFSSSTSTTTPSTTTASATSVAPATLPTTTRPVTTPLPPTTVVTFTDTTATDTAPATTAATTTGTTATTTDTTTATTAAATTTAAAAEPAATTAAAGAQPG